MSPEPKYFVKDVHYNNVIRSLAFYTWSGANKQVNEMNMRSCGVPEYAVSNEFGHC